MVDPDPDHVEAPRADTLRATIVLGGDPSAEQLDVLEALIAARPGWVLETASDDWPLAALARRAIEAGTELLVAAGGDGTVSAVAGVIATEESPPPMAILPFGTANDFARTIGVLSVDAAIEAIERADEHAIDAIRVVSDESEEHIVINVANGGLAWDIGDSLDGQLKDRWGALAYARGAIDAIGHRQLHQISIQIDDEPAQRREVLTVAVSSGRTCGGGLEIAPTADPEDGVLEVTLLGDVGPAVAAKLAARMRMGPVWEDDALERFRGKAITLASDPPMRFVLDGELVPRAQVSFTVLPGAVRLFVGADYRREPAIGD